jgi:hypothetical protein
LFGFEAVVLNLLVGHLSVWTCSLLLVLMLYRTQDLPKSGVISALFESLFVPAYLVNLNKKILRLRQSEICALRLHIRRLKRTSDADAELVRYELLIQTISALDDEVDDFKSDALQGFARCLKA